MDDRASNDSTDERFFHGTRAELLPGDLIEPRLPADEPGEDTTATYVYLTRNPDEAIWEAELADGESAGRIYAVEPLGEIGDAAIVAGRKAMGHPSMSLCSRGPLRVIREVTEWPLYHGTRADLKPGDLIEPGYTSNYGKRTKAAYVYLTRTLDAATWGAELAVGADRGRIYLVQATGPIEDDPNLTNKRFRGNPTKSYRSRHPLRVIGEIERWQSHAPEALKAMREGLERLARLGVEAIED